MQLLPAKAWRRNKSNDLQQIHPGTIGTKVWTMSTDLVKKSKWNDQTILLFPMSYGHHLPIWKNNNSLFGEALLVAVLTLPLQSLTIWCYDYTEFPFINGRYVKRSPGLQIRSKDRHKQLIKRITKQSKWNNNLEEEVSRQEMIRSLQINKM